MSELTNLLPPDRIRALSGEYRLRVIAVSATLAALLIGVHGALLFPTYLYLSEEVKTRQAHLDGLAASLASSEEQEVAARISALSGNAESLATLLKAPSASSAVRAVLSVSHPGISITGITVSRPESGESQMRVMGVASTRDALNKYYKAVSQLPSVSKADLPLSVYAEESDISFSLALFGTLTP